MGARLFGGALQNVVDGADGGVNTRVHVGDGGVSMQAAKYEPGQGC